MNIATSLRHAPWSTDTLNEYIFRRANQMCADPSLIKAALGLPPIWYGEPHWNEWESGENLADLEQRAYERMDSGDLSPLELADMEAALGAIEDFRQRRSARD